MVDSTYYDVELQKLGLGLAQDFMNNIIWVKGQSARVRMYVSSTFGPEFGIQRSNSSETCNAIAHRLTRFVGQ